MRIFTLLSIIRYLLLYTPKEALLAEMEGFEPPVPKSTTDFESASLRPLRYISVPLFTAGVLYQPFVEKSRFFAGSVILFYKLQDFPQFLADEAVVFPAMGANATGAVLDSLVRIPEAAPALLTQSVQWAVAEQAAETLRVRPLVTRKILTFPVLKKIVMAHSSSNPRPKPDSGVNRCLQELFQITCHCEPARTLVWQSPC